MSSFRFRILGLLTAIALVAGSAFGQQYTWPGQYGVPNGQPTYGYQNARPLPPISGVASPATNWAPDRYPVTGVSSNTYPTMQAPSSQVTRLPSLHQTSDNGPQYGGPTMRLPTSVPQPTPPYQTGPIAPVAPAGPTNQGSVIHGSVPPAPNSLGLPSVGGACDTCGTVGCATCCSSCKWFGGAYGLVLGRKGGADLWLSYDTDDIRNRTLTSRDAAVDWSGGVETRFGMYFNCGRNALEAVYWGVYPGTSEATTFAGNGNTNIDSILHFDGIGYDPGTGFTLVGGLFLNAEMHRVQRSYEAHNIELNVLGNCFMMPLCGCKGSSCGGCDSCKGMPCGHAPKCRLGWSAGFRYIKFSENFLYSADPIDRVFNGAPEEVHYEIDVDNHLFGFQVGGRADYCMWGCLTPFLDTKVGIFANHVKHRSRIYGSNGVARVTDAASPYFDQAVDIASNSNDFSVVGEVRLGLDWQFAKCWSVNMGYRVVGISGIALATNQVPVDFIGALDSVKYVDTNCALILHGGYAGLEFCF